MKQVSCLFFAASIIFMISFLERAQAGQQDGGGRRSPTDRERGSGGSDRDQWLNKERDRLRVDKKGELRDYEIMQPTEVPKPELNRAYQLDIIKDFKQLNEASDALLIAVQGTDEKCLKDVSKLAEKIAKCSKRLRQKLSQGGSVSKAEPILLNSVEGQTGQLRQLAESIDNLVEQVSTSKHESITTVSIEHMKQLEAIEIHALSLRTLVKGKG